MNDGMVFVCKCCAWLPTKMGLMGCDDMAFSPRRVDGRKDYPMTTPQTDAPTLQERLRTHICPQGDAEIMDEAADALDAHEATIAALVEALEWYEGNVRLYATDTTDAADLAGDNFDADRGRRARSALAKAAALKLQNPRPD